jgi:hypothetical protein
MGLRLMSATAILLSLVCVQSANAEGGCGPGFHRGLYGACRPNGPVVVPGAPVVVAPSRRTPAGSLRRWLPLASGIQALRNPLTAHWLTCG